MADLPNEFDPPTFVAAFPSAVMSWLVMMAAGLAFGALVESRSGHLDSGSVDEYVIAFLLGMPVPFALVIAMVFTPVVLGVRVVSSEKASPLALGGACVVAAPVAGLLLLAIGSIVWGQPATGGGYGKFVPPLLAIALGGLAFGLVFGRVGRPGGFSN